MPKFISDDEMVKLEGTKKPRFISDDDMIKRVSPSETESIGRGLAKGASLGFQPEAAGAEGVIADKLGRMGVDPVESTHPEVQAQLDAIAEARTPSAGAIFDKTKSDAIAANDLAEKTNPMGFLGGELAGGLAGGSVAGKALGSAATTVLPGLQDIPIGETLKTGAKLIPGVPSYLSKASSAVGDLKSVIAANRAARLAENVVEAGETLGPEAREKVKQMVRKSVFDPFTKKIIQP